LKHFAPQVNAAEVIHAGASHVREVVFGSDLHDVLLAFNRAVKHEFYMAAALSCLTVLSGLGMGWKKKTVPAADVERQPGETSKGTERNQLSADVKESKE
jgi:hypothetical protein